MGLSMLARALVLGAVLALTACGAPDATVVPTEGLGMFVGAVDDTRHFDGPEGRQAPPELFIAIVAAEHPAAEHERVYYAYLCDGAERSTWLLLESDGEGAVLEAGDVTVTLSGVGSNRLTNGADALTGEVSIAGEPTRAFTAERAQDDAGLYRGELVESTGHASARSASTRYVGGWIILNSGHQLGAVTVDGVVVDNPTLDVATGSVVSSVGTFSGVTTLPCIPVPRFGCIPVPQLR